TGFPWECFPRIHRRIVVRLAAYAHQVFTGARDSDSDCHLALKGSHEEAFGTAGNGSPANPLRTSPARNFVNGTISSPTLAFSRASTYMLRSPTGMTVQG